MTDRPAVDAQYCKVEQDVVATQYHGISLLLFALLLILLGALPFAGLACLAFLRSLLRE